MIRHRVVFALITGVFIDTLLLLADARLAPGVLVIPPLAAGVLTLAGEMLFLAFGVRPLAAWLPAAFVAGTTLTSLAMLVPTTLLQWSAQSAFLAWTVLVLLAALVCGHRWRRAPALSWPDAALALPLALVVAFFSRDFAQAEPTLVRAGLLPTWLDYFAHGTVIASFGSPLAVSAGDIMLPGVARVFYHYGPFMLPAALSEISGLSGLALATAILLPLGLYVGLCGLVALAAELAGIGIALVAVWLVIFLPDASHYGLANGFLGFHWLVFTAPGSAYAIGTAAVAYACALGWFEHRRTGHLLLAGLLTLMLVLVRAHMFLLLAPSLVAAAVLEVLPPRQGRWLLWSGIAAAAGLTMALVAGLLGPGLLHFAQPIPYITSAFANGPPAIAAEIAALGPVGGTLMGGTLLLPATLGVWTLALPAAMFGEARAGRLRPADHVPALMCAAYLVLIFWAPMAANNNLSEYKHRHFVLLYAVVATWTAVRLLGLVGAARLLSGWPAPRAALAVGATTIATLFAYGHVDPARPSPAMTWADAFYGPRVDPGIPPAARFLRAHAAPGDRMMAGGGTALSPLRGPALELVSMTDLPCYAGRIDQAMETRPPDIVALVKARAADIAAVDGAAQMTDAFALLKARGVRWYVMVAPNLPAWDRDGSRASYHAGNVYVYDTSQVPGATPPPNGP